MRPLKMVSQRRPPNNRNRSMAQKQFAASNRAILIQSRQVRKQYLAISVETSPDPPEGADLQFEAD